MRHLIAIAALVLLAGCQSWDWRASGRSLLESACNSVGNCAVSCAGNATEGWCQ
jgi:hypothetical protein